ncbi:MAG: DUF3108 domain-containing protein [Ignavibacterium sp.]|jgi:hypothetical protein|nr:DUF3108 domain-containing protein [Ignavibacterium sp.]
MKTIIKILLIVAGFNSFELISQTSPVNNGIFYPSETLVYKVKWTFLRIGTITIKTIPYEGNADCIKVSMLVESNPSIPFVDIREYNESVIDRESLMSNSFYGFYRNGSDEVKYTTEYDKESKTSVSKVFDVTNHRLIDSVKINKCPRYLDGPSLFFFTRANSKQIKVMNVPTIIESKIENTKLIFTGNKEEIEIDALDYPVMSNQYFGFADWEGGTSQNLSGEFMGWISNDEAAIPLYAEVKVLLGSLKIELESWNRGNWHKQLSADGTR